MNKINLAGCIIIQNNSILLLHRIKKDWYELPGGKIDNGETPKSAAIRECKEELLVDIKIIKKFGQKNFLENSYKMGYTWFLADIVKGETLRVGEPDKFDHFKFIKIKDLPTTPLSDNMKNVMEKLKKLYIS